MDSKKINCSVAKSCPAPCNTRDCNMPGVSVLHHLPEFASVQFSSVAQSCPTLCNPMNCMHQASLSITNS